MRVITCAGYCATGSSAVTDYFREFDGVLSIGGDTELRFIQDPGGISDLEFAVVENNHRHNTSHAIKQYAKFAKRLNDGNLGGKGYRRFFGSDFESLTEKYLDNITQLKTRSWWHMDRVEKGVFAATVDRLYAVISERFNGAMGRPLGISTVLCRNEYGFFSCLDREAFYSYTKEYLDDLFSSANPERKEFVMVDQLVPASNVERYCNYFKDIKVVVVDRDPRDLYLQYKLQRKYEYIPVRTPEEFCIWYKLTRKHRDYEEYNPMHAMLVRFEDMVYEYATTTKTLRDFVGLSETNRVRKGEFFNPGKSRVNTKLYKKTNDFNEDIRFIENELARYLYPYE